MNSFFKRGYLALGVAFLLFNLIAFLIPVQRSVSFVIAYIFATVAFVVQIFIWRLSVKRDRSLKSLLLGFPIVYIGAIYLGIQVVASFCFIAVPVVPPWLVILVCSVILGIAVICMIATDAARDEIVRIDEKIEQRVAYIRDMQSDVEMLAEREKVDAVKSKLQELAEKIRFSDPMGYSSTAIIEEKLTADLENLKNAFSDGFSCEDKITLIDEFLLLLLERNKKCRMHKENR